MIKKLGLIAASLVMMLAAGITVYGNEYDLNQDVTYLFVQGIDYNSIYREESVSGVNYDAATNTLTVENCNINDTKQEHFISYEGRIPLNIVFKGTNNFKTLTSKRDDGTEYANTGFIYSWGIDNTDNADINISGDGIINLENYENIVGTSSTDFFSDIFISGVTINANSGYFSTYCGNINIDNAVIRIRENQHITSPLAMLNAGENAYMPEDTDGNGTISIRNSIVEIKEGKNTSGKWDWLVRCKRLNVSGGNIYAGKENAENSYTAETLLSGKTYAFEQELTYYTPETLGYFLITPEILHLTQSGNTQNNNSSNVNSNENKNQTNTGTGTASKLGKVTSLKAKNVKGKKVKLTWKKIAAATGYQVMYGQNKKMSKGKKTTKVKKATKQIKKLKKNKTYYFKVRAYRVSQGSTTYGAWSAVKKVKIKK